MGCNLQQTALALPSILSQTLDMMTNTMSLIWLKEKNIIIQEN